MCRFVSLLFVAIFFFPTVNSEAQVVSGKFQKAAKVYKAGNYKEAYDLYRKIFLGRTIEEKTAPQELRKAYQCLRNLGRLSEFDEFIEAVVSKQSTSWSILDQAARLYREVQHSGNIISGNFSRGHNDGKGKFVNSLDRDRVRSIQLTLQAIAKADTARRSEQAQLFYGLSEALAYQPNLYRPWRLHYLSDLSALPDYEESQGFWHYRSQAAGAAVDKDGKPIFFSLPESFEAAENDGERWRWALDQVKTLNPARHDEIVIHRAQFLHRLFGVRSLGSYLQQPAFRGEPKKHETSQSLFAVHTLGENETIARLASGIKRFKLPDDHNYLALYKSVADSSVGSANTALVALAEVFEDRRQYGRAAEFWKEAIARTNPNQKDYRRKRLDQIVGAWGSFQPLAVQPAGKNAVVNYRYRNGTSVQTEAYRINLDLLVKDIKTYLESNPKNFGSSKIQLNNIGHRLLYKNESTYIGKKVADWVTPLDPPDSHYDAVEAIETPLKEAGTYLLKSRIAGGNQTTIVLWIEDIAVVEKPLDAARLYFLADAGNGKPLSNAELDFFGYKRQSVGGGRNYRSLVTTKKARARTNHNGLYQSKASSIEDGYNWLITVKKGDKKTYHGFSRVWYPRYHRSKFYQTKVFGVTNQPVYRPGQTVKYALWAREASYDKETGSKYAGQEFKLLIQNPRSEQLLKTRVRTDQYGGVQGELVLPEDAALGVYTIQLQGLNYNSVAFRVEEYKKPEFEVKVQGPEKPLALGETIKAKITANYLHGAPVTEAKVNYKVMRKQAERSWFPYDPWNGFYGPGYWWFCDEYSWYPGWHLWGFRAPHPRWWHRPQEPPELVQQGEGKLQPDGSFEVLIDTTLAKELHGDKSNKYEISVTVTDASRRAIDGQGSVTVSNGLLSMLTWVDRGYYQIGDYVNAFFNVQSSDGKPISYQGELRLYSISFKEDGTPEEELVEKWQTKTDEQGQGSQKFQVRKAGQYRLAYVVEYNDTQESGYVFSVFGGNSESAAYRFNDLEIVAEKRTYNPGEKLALRINSDQPNSTVLLFLRPDNGVYAAPKVLTLKGKSQVYEIPIAQGDMPNFYVEAVSVTGAKVHTRLKEIFVPPEKRKIKTELIDIASPIKPGEEIELKLKLTDLNGKPFVGSTVITVYDKALEYISGGPAAGDIFNYFWKWKRHHNQQQWSNLQKQEPGIAPKNEKAMQHIGVFGQYFARSGGRRQSAQKQLAFKSSGAAFGFESGVAEGSFADAGMSVNALKDVAAPVKKNERHGRAQQETVAPVKLRSEFADSAFWQAGVETDDNGITTVRFKAPENLTTWKIHTWAMGFDTRVGEATAEFITTKNLLLRLQAPRFFVEGDEVLLSANVHNYLEESAGVTARLELVGETLSALGELEQEASIDANGEQRFDWRVKVNKEGDAIIRMYALSSEESDAVEMSFPVYVHGMEKVETVSSMIGLNQNSTELSFTIPEKRKPEQSRFELRYSPSLAFAMIDALPYLVNYPYGCTEQTLSRFLPTVIVRKVLLNLGLKLPDLDRDLSKLNSQLRAPIERRWREYRDNPVFSEAKVLDMAQVGLARLQSMQVSDGGWGWFSGSGSRSYPHTTAYVVHGLQIAQQQDLPVDGKALQRGVAWLAQHQATEIQKLKNAATKTKPYKTQAGNIDAFVYLVLADAGKENKEMANFLYRDRTHLAVYSKAMLGIGLHSVLKREPGRKKQLEMILRNIKQYLVEDSENQTAYLKLPNQNYYWYWYGSSFEAHAYYLKLLTRTSPKSKIASGIAKYLLNNRRQKNYWNSTRDTAVVIEALAEFIEQSGEANPDMTVEVLIDGKKHKEVRITKDNLFEFDNAVILSAEQLSSGSHTVEIRKTGRGVVYSSAYTSNFTLEDFITKAGLEVKVDRSYYKLEQREAERVVANQYGQATAQKKLAYTRIPIRNLDEVRSGDLIEIELSITTKNDYEYLIFEDMKAAGFEPVEVRSGYTGNELGAYVEFRDNRVVFFIDHLKRGSHSVSYRMRAEIPGTFSALPTKAAAMYAPEIRANSDEIKVRVGE